MNDAFHPHPAPLFTAATLCLLFCWLVASADAQNQPVATRPAWTTSRIHGSPEAPAPYRLSSAFPRVRFDLPTSLEEIPGANRLLITERTGKIFTLAKSAEVDHADLVVNLRDWLPDNLLGQNLALWDAELHPKFKENRNLFICYVHPGEGGHTRVSRLTVTADAAPRAVPGTEKIILTWPAGGHNAGCLEFGTDGSLYIATGDGSGPNPPDARTTGQDISDLFGAILRIDVDRESDDRPYSIPTDNPFVDTTGARPEIWAYGLRNPWKFGIDRQTNDIFVADNGWESWEMVHRLVRGGNCGWPVMEGRAALRSEVKPGPTPIIPPVKDHPHTEANSVIGGPVYRGQKLPGLEGSFVYGDYITGTIWSIRPDKDGAYSCQTLVDTDQRIVAFCEGANGELFVLDYDLTGQIYELLPSGLSDTSANFPRRLSETGLFVSLETMQPANGVVPYFVQVDPWMDGARAARWLAVPGTAKIELASADGQPATFPEGTVLVKHLTLPANSRQPIRIETQLLHYENGVWNPYSYLWDAEGTDAQLVESMGANRPLHVTSSTLGGESQERTWRVNATNECKLCHNAGPGFVLGFVPNQLNFSTGGSGSNSSNQLMRLVDLGVLAKAPHIAADDPAQLVDLHNTQHSLNNRARTYLHVNCSMCHHPGGNAIVSFFLRRDLPFEKLNTNKGTGIGTFGIRDAKIIAPGDPHRSLLLFRMSKLGYARMPYIGSQVVDSKGVALIEDWIQSLTPDAASASSPLTGSETIDAQRLSLLKTATITSDQREESLRACLQSTESALALAGQLHRATIPMKTAEAAASLGSAWPTSDIRGLFETFVPESKRKVTLGSTIEPGTILQRPGDRQRGKLIFFSDSARCRACHEIDEPEKSLGPTLQEINKKYAQTAELLEHVLRPSQKIDEAYAAYSVLTTDGRAIQGILVDQNEKEIVLKTTEKKILKLARDSVAEIQKSQASLMPDRILSDLTAQEASDLLSYIQSLGGPK